MRQTAWCSGALALVGCWAVACETGVSAGSDASTADAREPCEVGGGSGILSAAGLLAGADYWACRRPPAGEGGAAFTGVAGGTAVVSGGSTVLRLGFTGADSLAGRLVIIGFNSEQGYYAVEVSQAGSPLEAELFVARDAWGGVATMYLGIDDGTGTAAAPHLGAVIEIPFEVIPVHSGDLQFSLNWDTNVDLDLHVVDPLGDEVYYGHRTVPSGGALDLDSYAACRGRQRFNENIYWDLGRAPSGTYQVRVDYWSACALEGTATETRFRVTVITAAGEISTYDGSFLPEQADGGGAGSGVEVLTVEWPGP